MKSNRYDNFIDKAKKIYNDKYDYSLVDYINAKTKVKIICPIHGVFEQRPDNHLYSKYGCMKCSHQNKNDKNKNFNNFLKKSKNIHKDKYDYTLVNYINAKNKVKIICPEHGVFEQKPYLHLQGNNCPNCSKDNKFSCKDIFVEKSKKIHNNKYDYSLVNYINAKTKVKIICPIHGIFEQRPNNHLIGNKCPYCDRIDNRKRTIKRIEQNKLNGNQLYPNFNKIACKVFDEISLKENIHIQHAMNGGEYYIKELGYWVDGYDEVNNVVYEFDEEFHKYQTEKDEIRQKEIEKNLKCKFVRIKK